ncbi:MAG: MOSC domain-containing protein, partial [Actinomycetota bacterium]
DEAVGRLEEALSSLADLVRSVPARDRAWRRTLTTDGEAVDAAWLLRHVVHDVTHHLMDVGRGLVQLGAGAPRQEGRVAQVNVSDGGVPKLPVAEAEVTWRGLAGDRQKTRQHHGRPFQALCLWSAEVIEGLQAEGHPIGLGSAGENLTLAGIDWTTLRPGTRLQIGEVEAEISAWAQPCKKNAGWFADRDFRRMEHDRHPGWSRAYAWVRTPGRVRTGDRVVVEP